MEVAALARQTILLIRAYRCEPHHVWRPVNETEDQCAKCGVIATATGKRNLAQMAARHFGRPVPP